MDSRAAAKRRLAWTGLATGVVAAAVGSLLLAAPGGGHPSRQPETQATAATTAEAAASDAALVPGTPAAFRYLASQHSNSCGLTARELGSYSASERLQGSCCDPMDQSTYEWQVKALRPYASIPLVPRDPYDISVSLARELIALGNSIHLSALQRATYDDAMHESTPGGPCCCHCWRWSAFKGLSNYLIARRGFPASQLALVIDDVEGCGGPGQRP